ncbi:MAG: AbrB/MazE/SpoVT family DNA-binding domain-containing protein [Candidatus Sericytochromatia bacterium]|nr:AbrB/MazE/SpoVT family DNA-binding domain-containing protein [Candidatus Sericytochromatia bacterium]
MAEVTVSSKFQIVIPKAIREEAGIKAGQKLVILAKGNSLHLVPKRDVAWLIGSAKGANPADYRDRSDK